MVHKILRSLFVTLGFATIFSCYEPTINADDKKDIQYLIETNVFYGVRINTDARYSQGAISYANIRNSSDYIDKFMHIYQHAELPGKVYALIGLWRERNDFVIKQIELLLQNHKTIHTHINSLIEPDDSLSNILKNNSILTVRLSDTVNSLHDWLALSRNQNGFYLDVFGGGYTEVFDDVVKDIFKTD